ncbi:MAG: hypothetical protein MI757_15880, partial [Pirellulales bacterium]|nr:hypothetical protein [Pirellulales bacterium]
MRLTLRTLLNYMDDMLEPSDAAEIRKKVEESQFASDLMQRTRTVVGRMRLGVPKVSGRGMGVDANTVADYLDHELDSDDVQEFEKICLESDIHLAEVAGCHQILALVLGEPATVEPAARDRMYKLKELRHDKTFAAKASQDSEVDKEPAPEKNKAKAPAPAPKDTSPREKPEVPDYLRDRRRMPLWSVVATVLVAAALGAGLWMTFDPNNPISAWLAGDDPDVADQEPRKVADDLPPASGPIDSGKSPGVDDGPIDDPTKPVDTPADPTKPDEPIDDPKVPDRIKLPMDPMIPDETPMDPTPMPEPDPDAGLIPDPMDPTKKPDDEPKPEDPVDPGPDPMPEDPMTDPAPVDEPGTVEVGRFLTGDQMLVRKDPEQNDWFLVPGRAALASGDHVLALPTYRPTITLTAGVTLQVPGGTSLELLKPDKDGVAGVRLNYGRLVLLNNGAVGTQCRVQLGDGSKPVEGMVTFAGPASTAAIEVQREFRAGQNPEDEKTPLVAELGASGGDIAWESADKSVREEIDPSTHLLLRSDAPAKRLPNSAVFAWLETDDISKRDRLASPEMKKNINEGRSVVLSLRELADHRRFEVRSLAVRSLGHLNFFEPLVA